MGATPDTMSRDLESAAQEPLPAGRRVRTWLAVAVLIALCFVAFSNTLQCYFIADDSVPLAYLYSGFNGEFSALLARLVQPWQDATVQLLYRPVCELTMIFDYWLWHGEPAGYHLTNIIWHAVATVSLFFVCRRLVERASGDESSPALLPFIAAALFAVTPLHTETVAWMIGRVDSVCTSFYLLSFLCFISSSRGRWLGLPLFALALLSKEMAVTLPAVLVLYGLIFETRGNLVQAVKNSVAYWVALVPYFLLRVLILGTPLGGYIGSIGEVFQLRAGERIFQCRWDKIFYPFSNYALSESSWSVRSLHILYAAAGIIVAARWLRGTWRKPAIKLSVFACGWFVLALLPAVSVWYLNSAVTGGRFLYLGSAAFYLGLTSVLMLPAAKQRRYPGGLQSAAVALFGAFVVCFASVTQENNNVWVKSGENARAFRAAVEAAVRKLPSDRKLVLCNMPKQANDEHLFYTSDMYISLMKPPLTNPDLSERISCWQPNCYVPGNPLNISRVRQMLDSGKYEFCLWDGNNRQIEFLPPHMVQSATEEVSEIPQLKPLHEPENDSMLLPPFNLHFDVSKIPNATGAILEISHPNSFFVHYTRTFRDTELSPYAARHVTLSRISGTMLLPVSDFPAPAIYQVRIAAIDANRHVVGSLSDPVTLDTRERNR